MVKNIIYPYLLEQIPAAISLVGSLLIILIYATFQKIRAFKHIELIFYIACSDCVVSVGLLIGKAPTGTFACWYQGLSVTSCFLSSIFWNAIVAYHLHLIVVKNDLLHLQENMIYCHLICWIWPLVLTLIPLSNVTYGSSDSYAAGCYLSNRSNSKSWYILFWEVAAFYFWLWLATGIIIYYYALVFQRLREIAKDVKIIPQAISLAVKQLVFYPLIMIICWLVNTIFVLIYGLNVNVNDGTSAYFILGSMSVILPCCQGALSALVFFVQNRNAREHLFMLCRFRSQDAEQNQLTKRYRSNLNTDNRLSTPFHSEGNLETSMYTKSEAWGDGRISDLELSYARDSNPYTQDPTRDIAVDAAGTTRISEEFYERF